ncbi:MAG: hypothetical protein ACXVR1_02690 [Solirubrobacteraceae bacterium]
MPCPVRPGRILLVILAAAGVTACGSSGGPSGATTGAGGSGQALKFANCMRTSGVPNFPDPSAGGGLLVRPGSGLNPASPAFQAAQKHCARLQPGGAEGPGRPTKAQVQRALTFAKCVRAHGLSRFPDPLTTSPNGHGPIIVLQGMMFVPGSGFDPRSPAFRQAASHCGVRLPSPPAGS